ncbi:phosphatidylethanolamine-binding protein [Xylariales sp. AK1849]|nr:phosphatidylethanolamine-binding protein [Xylariales sp. AK1849]
MLFESLAVLAVATVSLAATPQGFQPASQIPLTVSFNGLDGTGGKGLAQDVTQKAPQLATASRLTGTTFAVIMMDLDIPTNSPPQTSTLLHWMQTGLTQSSTATLLNSTAGRSNVFAFAMPGAVAAAAPYLGPAPPARTPLSHRYTQILVDTSKATQANMNVLLQAAQNRQGFNAETVLTQAGLQNMVVAGNFFNVTNPGPAQAATGNSTTGSGSARGTGTTAQPTKSSTPFKGEGASYKASGLLLGAALVGLAFAAM